MLQEMFKGVPQGEMKWHWNRNLKPYKEIKIPMKVNLEGEWCQHCDSTRCPSFAPTTTTKIWHPSMNKSVSEGLVGPSTIRPGTLEECLPSYISNRQTDLSTGSGTSSRLWTGSRPSWPQSRSTWKTLIWVVIDRWESLVEVQVSREEVPALHWSKKENTSLDAVEWAVSRYWKISDYCKAATQEKAQSSAVTVTLIKLLILMSITNGSF